MTPAKNTSERPFRGVFATYWAASLWVMRSALQLVVRPFELLSTLDSILSFSGYNILHMPRNVKYFLCEIYLKFSKIAKQPNKLQKHL